jgi:hypothetical protein
MSPLPPPPNLQLGAPMPQGVPPPPQGGPQNAKSYLT